MTLHPSRSKPYVSVSSPCRSASTRRRLDGWVIAKGGEARAPVYGRKQGNAQISGDRWREKVRTARALTIPDPIVSLRGPCRSPSTIWSPTFAPAPSPARSSASASSRRRSGTRPDGAPVRYGGPDGIEDVLARLEGRGFAATREDGQVVALERAGERITIEPGGQLELSGAARATAAACRDALVAHVREVGDVARPLGVRFLRRRARGRSASSTTSTGCPSARYDVMRDYFPRHGRSSPARAPHDEDDRHRAGELRLRERGRRGRQDPDRLRRDVDRHGAVRGVAVRRRAARPATRASARRSGWRPTRIAAGCCRSCSSPSFSFPRLRRVGAGRPDVLRRARRRRTGRSSAMTFRRFMAEGFEGEAATIARLGAPPVDAVPRGAPQALHRGARRRRGADADGGGAGRAVARAARRSRRARGGLGAGREAVRSPSARRCAARCRGRRCSARLGGRPLRELAVELCRIADAGLARLPGGEEDRPLLAPLWAYAAAGRTPADDLLDDFAAAGGDPAKLVAKWELKP